MTTRTQAARIALLRRRIAESGLSLRQWASDVVIRDRRTVERWLKGESPIPQAVLDFLEGETHT